MFEDQRSSSNCILPRQDSRLCACLRSKNLSILSKNKILVLDEATASVDRRTDQLLHDSLHDSFEGSTIIAVAHRLDTIIDHDYILVFGLGKVLEFGPPAELIRSGGTFSQMVEETGEIIATSLKQRAFGAESAVASA